MIVIAESDAVVASIERLHQRDYHAMHEWVWSNPDRAIVVSWDGDNEIEIAERSIALGYEAAQKNVSVIVRADVGEQTYFFLEDEASVVKLVDSL